MFLMNASKELSALGYADPIHLTFQLQH